jgi:hypothetical protein
MTWARFCDRHHESDKVNALNDAAYRLWSMLLTWASQSENWWRHGFIPVASLPTISRNKWSLRKLDRLAKDLVNARGSGKSGMGLLEPREGGWQIHDWHEYEPPEPKISKKESASLAGKRSAEVRKVLHGTAQPNKRTERPSNVFDNRSSELRPERLSNDVEPPDPDPKLNINLRSEDLTRSRVRPVADAEREAKNERINSDSSRPKPPSQGGLVLVHPGGVAGALASVTGSLRRMPRARDAPTLARRPATAAELDAILEQIPREVGNARNT